VTCGPLPFHFTLTLGLNSQNSFFDDDWPCLKYSSMLRLQCCVEMIKYLFKGNNPLYKLMFSFLVTSMCPFYNWQYQTEIRRLEWKYNDLFLRWCAAREQNELLFPISYVRPSINPSIRPSVLLSVRPSWLTVASMFDQLKQSCCHWKTPNILISEKVYMIDI